MSAEKKQANHQENDEHEGKAPSSLGELLQHFIRATSGEEKVSLKELLDSLDSRSHGPMLLLPAFISISPIGAIPGMSIATGTMIILIAIQMMVSKNQPWIPKRITSLEFSRETLKSGVRLFRRWVLWIEKVIFERLTFLTHGIAIIPIAIVSIVLAISFYPLAVVPMGVFLPGLAVTVFALGMTARDGILIILGYVLTIGTAVLAYYVWPSIEKLFS